MCTNVHDDYEKIEMMIDSGASETVASQDKFPSYEMVETTATGTTYSSVAEKQAESIVNMGQKYVQVDTREATRAGPSSRCAKG